ncbi:MAG: hypothetical protein KatS3mg108_1848 [Isosphaeraceae bacterium]|nr:MAG: hypothetical protein KatS3mg108_1848 [Isosphaeraceae bacterium]
MLLRGWWPKLVILLVGAGIAGAQETKPFRGKPHAIPGTIEMEDYDEGGEGVAYHDADPENLEKEHPPYRDGGVDLEWRAAASQDYNLGWTRPGEWLIYTVEVTESGTYRIDAMVACQGEGGTFRLEFDGKDVSGPIRVPDTGGWQHLKPMRHEGIKLTAGTYRMKLVLDTPGVSGSIGDIDYLRFTRAGD